MSPNEHATLQKVVKQQAELLAAFNALREQLKWITDAAPPYAPTIPKVMGE